MSRMSLAPSLLTCRNEDREALEEARTAHEAARDGAPQGAAESSPGGELASSTSDEDGAAAAGADNVLGIGGYNAHRHASGSGGAASAQRRRRSPVTSPAQCAPVARGASAGETARASGADAGEVFYEAGQMVWYRERGGAEAPARVTAVDRSLRPYAYQIALHGNVRDTEGHRLRPRKEGAHCCRSACERSAGSCLLHGQVSRASACIDACSLRMTAHSWAFMPGCVSSLMCIESAHLDRWRLQSQQLALSMTVCRHCRRRSAHAWCVPAQRSMWPSQSEA